MSRGPDGGPSDALRRAIAFRQYINEDAPLWRRFDFLGLIADIGKGTVLAFLSILSGGVLAFQGAFVEFAAAVERTISNIVLAVGGAPGQFVDAAVAEAQREISLFGFFALPAAVLVVVTAFVAVGFVTYIFIGGD